MTKPKCYFKTKEVKALIKDSYSKHSKRKIKFEKIENYYDAFVELLDRFIIKLGDTKPIDDWGPPKWRDYIGNVQKRAINKHNRKPILHFGSKIFENGFSEKNIKRPGIIDTNAYLVIASCIQSTDKTRILEYLEPFVIRGNEKKISSKYFGQYFGYHVDNNFRSDNEVGALRTIILDLNETASSIKCSAFSDDEMHFDLQSEKSFHDTEKGTLEMEFDKRIKLTIDLKSKLKSGSFKETILYGTYTGFEEYNQKHLQVGILVFHKIENDLVPEAEKCTVYNYSKSQQTDSQTDWLFEKLNARKHLMKAFNDYVDSPLKALNSAIYYNERYKGPIGTFYLFSCARIKNDGLVLYGISINKNGEVLYKHTDTEPLRGVATLEEESYGLCLKLDFNEILSKNACKGTYMFGLKNIDYQYLKLAFGISLRVNGEGKPQAKREILVRLSEEVEKNLKFKCPVHRNDELLSSLPSEYFDILQSLYGPEYNQMVVPRETLNYQKNHIEDSGKGDRNKKRINYKEVFLNYYFNRLLPILREKNNAIKRNERVAKLEIDSSMRDEDCKYLQRAIWHGYDGDDGYTELIKKIRTLCDLMQIDTALIIEYTTDLIREKKLLTIPPAAELLKKNF